MTESQKQKAIQERIVIKDLAHKHSVKCVEFNSRSFRLNKGGKVIDVYTKSMKCFWHSDHVWGVVQNLDSFITFEYAYK